MVLTVTEDTPADMLAGSMELLVQLPRDLHTQRLTVLRSTPMMDLLVQIATAHKLSASNYTLQAIGEHGLVLSHHPNTPIGVLDVLQVKLLPKQSTCVPRKTKQANQPFEPTFRLQVHLPRNQLYVSRVSPKMNLGEILDEVCREKNLDKNNYELRHPANLEETLDLSLSLQDYHLQEVTLYAKQGKSLGPTLSTQDIMALQRQEERRRQQTKQSVFGFMFKKSKESSLSTDSLGARSVSPARSDETARSASPLQPPVRPQRKRRPAPKPPTLAAPDAQDAAGDSGKDKTMINHSRNSSDSSGYHEASVLSDHPESAARLPETLPRRSKAPGMSNASRKLAQTSQSSKSLSNLVTTGGTLSRGISNTSLSSTGFRKKRTAPSPPTTRPVSLAISTQALERIVDSEASSTSGANPSKPSSDIGAPTKISSEIEFLQANSDIGVGSSQSMLELNRKSKSEVATYKFDGGIQQNRVAKTNVEARAETDSLDYKLAKADVDASAPVEVAPKVEQARVATKRVGEPVPLPTPRKVNTCKISASESPKAPKRKVVPPLVPPRILNTKRDRTNSLNEDDIAHVKLERTHSKSKIDSAPSTEDQKAIQEEETSKIDEDDMSLKLNQNPSHQMSSNLELQNPNCTESILIDPESKAKPLNGDGFSKEERLDVDNSEIHESLNLNNEENGLSSDSIELERNVLEKKSSLLISTEKENNTLHQDDNIKSENIASRDESENQRGKLNVSNDDSLMNKSTNNEQLKLLDDQSCEGPLRVPRKRLSSSIKIEEGIETAKYLHPKDATCDAEVKSNFEKEEDTCTIISTIPKCDHFDVIRKDDALKYNIVENVHELCQKQIDQSEESNNGVKTTKRTKVIRSQSKSEDFEVDTLKRQKRHLTSPQEDIAHALNLKFSSRNSVSSQKEQEEINAEYRDDRARDGDVNKRESYDGLITANQDVLSTPTDILLQKVSDTLSNVLPAPSSLESETLPLKTSHPTASIQASINFKHSTTKPEPFEDEDESNEVYKSCLDLSEATLSASTPNITANSQENTSDYVSAMNEDLESISDWKYQLPTPPSAFRDSSSPTLDDDYDTITLGSVSAFKEPEIVNPIAESAEPDVTDSGDAKNLLNGSGPNFDQETQTSSIVSHKTPNPTNPDLRKEIITELESKIETGALAQTVNKDFDRRVDSLSAPKDNTLSNFMITTYTKQNSLDIYEELEESNSDNRFVKVFATLPRNSAENYGKKDATKKKKAKSEECPNVECKTEPKSELPHRLESLNNNEANEKVNIQRSKSYISISSNAKYQTEKTQQKIDKEVEEPKITAVKKSTSIADLNVDVLQGTEKFSQWRDNILKQQKEPSKEKQLQSLQVLKSILPQLKNAQQAEENISKERSSAILNEKKYEPEFTESQDSEPEYKPSSKEKNMKRYVYTGPPAISLGSWSERPSINVQIKTDTDYKLGRSNTNDSKSIVSITDARNEKDTANYASDVNKNNIANHKDKIHASTNKNNPAERELTRKLIAHTTASGFKAPTSNRVNVFDSSKSKDRPFVMGVELKKTFVETPKYGEDENDASRNVKELSNTFGQHMNFKQKPKRVNINRHSANYDTQLAEVEVRIGKPNVSKQNGHAKFAKASSQDELSFKRHSWTQDLQESSQARRYTSIVGINETSQGFRPQSEPTSLRCNFSNAVKINPPMPVVKGFKIPIINPKMNNNQINRKELLTSEGVPPPKLPTMPVITGVTLKNTNPRPKSVQLDSRDTLLESIRNFRREKLKNIAERY
ncbi:uncharacterized protein LOC114934785 isoform X2 [Nylanderia fulva]|nr:uncharacterized protein LOC114934785 isoform X2 [Nylanderia fulva]